MTPRSPRSVALAVVAALTACDPRLASPDSPRPEPSSPVSGVEAIDAPPEPEVSPAPEAPIHAEPTAPSAAARPPSPYCLLGLEPPCECAELSGLASSSDALGPEELAWAASQFAALAPTALPRAASSRPVVASAASCVALTGGKVYCRADLVGAANAELPVALTVQRACAPSGRCIALRFDVARVCPSAGGVVTAWADSTGFSALWGPGDARAVPGGVVNPP